MLSDVPNMLEIFQARVLEWVAIAISRRSSRPRDRTLVSCIVSRRFYRLSYQGSSLEMFRSDQIRSVPQLCPSLCDPMNRSTPGLPVSHQLPEFTQTHMLNHSKLPLTSCSWMILLLDTCLLLTFVLLHF